ncbi:undecaprenyl-phosphate glucose phosphotransferase [Psychroflexus sediminis]|uniref:Putative colanic acid biosysnthesis UDP-glucose lipid carrier transferase n=1 Tax=Psychroflexus sediminis TaxID=470826 RepID=A0A1G7UJE7_9FLAO|nr:undecaprenyl-phosphate glucose phosphotransferase [Psychroflexus sediminis]SDG47682.1 putative colanic acid biosysnthesis UDP-glucose lipid carrier transferase [Psychroflexus sediminis]
MARTGRYSTYIRPASYLIDLAVLIFFASQFKFGLEMNIIFFSYVTVSWILLSLYSNFYEVYRYTKFVKIASLTFFQGVLFTLLVFGFFGYFYQFGRDPNRIFLYLGKSFAVIFLIKVSLHVFLKKYREGLGGNFRTTIIIGDSPKSQQLKSFFDDNPEYGYQCQKLFKIRSNSNIESIHKFVLENEVDEIYCSMAKLTNEQINSIIKFADNNLKVLKFLPDNKDVYSRKLNYEYYGYLPILSLRKIPIDIPVNRFLKRFFDILLSLGVIVFILSWLTPLIAICIKIESKGAVFFKQKRNGLDYEEFYCYKFRSMKPNPEADLHQANKNDKRITKIGKFMRKTSIDELPQFFNVFKGDMSVVGPRPHMVSHTHNFAENVDKFMVRHFIKPGITGLAQVSGYRGEVETDQDIINRVKYDIFYLENWSLLLDIKIIFQTVMNAVKGEKKAY